MRTDPAGGAGGPWLSGTVPKDFRFRIVPEMARLRRRRQVDVQRVVSRAADVNVVDVSELRQVQHDVGALNYNGVLTEPSGERNAASQSVVDRRVERHRVIAGPHIDH